MFPSRTSGPISEVQTAKHKWLSFFHLCKTIGESKVRNKTKLAQEKTILGRALKEQPQSMAATSTLAAPSFLAHQSLCGSKLQNKHTPFLQLPRIRGGKVRAAKFPAVVEVPRVQPKLSEPFLGFTKTAEIWNSRACMIGLIGTFIVEMVLNKGILQMIGVEVGKGLNLPL